MPRGSYLPCLLLALCPVFLEGEEAVFLSNEIGMPLEPLVKGQEMPEYRLVVNRTSGTEIRTLLNREGRELKRWETRIGASGIPLEKKEFKEGALQRRISYDSKGRIIREEEFEGEKDAGTFDYLYTGTQYRGVTFKPLGSDSQDRASGYREQVLYTPTGIYRGLHRTYDSGATRITLASQSRGVLQRELFQGAGISFLARFNSRGDAIHQEVRKDGVPVEVSRFWYSERPSYHLERMETENLIDGTRRVLYYSPTGLLEREIETMKDVFLQEIRYTYQDKQLIQKELRTRRSRYRWEFQYREEGKKIVEKQYENEVLSLQIDFSPPEPFSRIESRYKGGSLVMRTYFQEDSEVLVEYYRDGVLLRSVKKGSPP
jgi:antitoxin component YwqK of YwqJK toxin-antitoxin module